MSYLDLKNGFTVIELVVVILLLAILAGVAVPLFFDQSIYRERAAYDEVAGAVRYAQKLAVASGCPVRVQLTADGYALQQQTSCGAGSFVTISSQHPVSSQTFSRVTISPLTGFVFDAMGRVNPRSDVSISVGSYRFAVIAESGYVDAL